VAEDRSTTRGKRRHPHNFVAGNGELVVVKRDTVDTGSAGHGCGW